MFHGQQVCLLTDLILIGQITMVIYVVHPMCLVMVRRPADQILHLDGLLQLLLVAILQHLLQFLEQLQLVLLVVGVLLYLAAPQYNTIGKLDQAAQQVAELQVWQQVEIVQQLQQLLQA